MSRPLRIDYPNAWHYIMNRARRGQDLFVDKADYQQFIDLLQEITDLFNINAVAYYLLPTHYHLMLQTPDANLSRCIRHLNGIYTQRYNVSPTQLKAVRRGMENESRDVAIYLIRSMHAEPLMRVGANFRLNQYSSVSSAVTRVKAKLQKDRKFKDRLEHIESNIPKGHA